MTRANPCFHTRSDFDNPDYGKITWLPFNQIYRSNEKINLLPWSNFLYLSLGGGTGESERQGQKSKNTLSFTWLEGKNILATYPTVAIKRLILGIEFCSISSSIHTTFYLFYYLYTFFIKEMTLSFYYTGNLTSILKIFSFYT